MKPANIFRIARALAGHGSWKAQGVIVSADKRAGYWQYDVGTLAKQYTYGRPAEVTKALVALLGAQ